VAALLVTPLAAFVTVILALAKGEPLAVRTVPAIRPSCAGITGLRARLSV